MNLFSHEVDIIQYLNSSKNVIQKVFDASFQDPFTTRAIGKVIELEINPA